MFKASNIKEISRRIEKFRTNGDESLDLSNLLMKELPIEIRGVHK